MSNRGFRVLIHVRNGGRYVLGGDLVASLPSTGSPAPAETFHLLTESGAIFVTESGDSLDIEHA